MNKTIFTTGATLQAINTKISIRFFNNREVRAIWGEEDNKWWFNVVDIAAVLSLLQLTVKNIWLMDLTAKQLFLL